MKISRIQQAAAAIIASVAFTFGCSPSSDNTPTPPAPVPTAPAPTPDPDPDPTTPPPPPPPATKLTSEEIFNQVCSTCHGPNGDGWPGAIPGFSDANTADNRLETQCNEELIHSIINGRGGMPSFGGRPDLLDEEGAKYMVAFLRSRSKHEEPECSR